jgi:hypothetical protein
LNGLCYAELEASLSSDRFSVRERTGKKGGIGEHFEENRERRIRGKSPSGVNDIQLAPRVGAKEIAVNKCKTLKETRQVYQVSNRYAKKKKAGARTSSGVE